MLQLGLIGISISKSRSPALHEMLGELNGIETSYIMHDPENPAPQAFRDTLQTLIASGYRGTNVTYPFKQLAVESAVTCNAAVQRVGSSNTLVLNEEGGIQAFNTDYTGFVRAFRSRLGDMPAGRVLLLGAGGVGRAVAFALFEVGATELSIFDLNSEGAASLAQSLQDQGFNARAISKDELAECAQAAQGLVNCTPVGHHKTPGIPLAPELFGQQQWAFDAVYTPVETEFLLAAQAAGLQIVSGFDLFIYQGIDAFEIFSGIQVDSPAAISAFKKRFEISSPLID